MMSTGSLFLATRMSTGDFFIYAAAAEAAADSRQYRNPQDPR
jgi:hypothetical protein